MGCSIGLTASVPYGTFAPPNAGVHVADSAYSQKLLEPEWLEKRNFILRRDHFTCLHCQSTKKLNVHHLIYLGDRDPWQYRDSDLITLCESCHSKQHYAGSTSQVQRGERAVAYPYHTRSLAEIIASAIG